MPFWGHKCHFLSSRLESSRDDFKLRCEVLERELTDSQSRMDDLSTLADESRMLKDEIDYLRSASDKAAKLEATVETYKVKLKELTDLRGQVLYGLFLYIPPSAIADVRIVSCRVALGNLIPPIDTV